MKNLLSSLNSFCVCRLFGSGLNYFIFTVAPEFYFREIIKATKLPTYRRNGKKISAEKKATKLPSY